MSSNHNYANSNRLGFFLAKTGKPHKVMIFHISNLLKFILHAAITNTTQYISICTWEVPYYISSSLSFSTLLALDFSYPSPPFKIKITFFVGKWSQNVRVKQFYAIHYILIRITLDSFMLITLRKKALAKDADVHDKL